MHKPLFACALGFVLSALPLVVQPAAAGQKSQVVEKKPEAVLAMVAGPVFVRRAGERIGAGFGTPLRVGDVVETGPGGQAGVLFQSGQVIEVGSASRISIGSLPKDAPGTAGHEDTTAPAPEVLAGQLTRFTHTSSGGEGLAAGPTLRSAGQEARLEAIAPRRTLVQPGAVTFSWTPVADAVEYRVALAGPGAANGSHRATTASWILPAEQALQPGESWTWSVEALTADGTQRSETYAFEVASAATMKELTALNAELQPFFAGEDETRHDLARYLVGMFCRSAGLYNDAAVQLEELASRHPERAELHQELGSIYQTIGRFDKAAEAYRLALKE